MKTIWFVLLGLILALPATAQQPPQDVRLAEEASQREHAIERCKANRGADCVTDAGLAEWLLQERQRSETESEGSRSMHQTTPKPTSRPAN